MVGRPRRNVAISRSPANTACILNDDRYRDRAFHLIEQVHETLERHHPEDARTGWISGLTETQGRARPTAGGLRIGKKLPERPQGEPPATALPDSQRLPFGECGLSLGLRTLSRMKGRLKAAGLEFGALDPYLPLATDIEDFWRSPQGQDAASWKEHLDINAVTLAASLVASRQPDAFAFIAGTDRE